MHHLLGRRGRRPAIRPAVHVSRYDSRLCIQGCPEAFTSQVNSRTYLVDKVDPLHSVPVHGEANLRFVPKATARTLRNVIQRSYVFLLMWADATLLWLFARGRHLSSTTAATLASHAATLLRLYLQPEHMRTCARPRPPWSLTATPMDPNQPCQMRPAPPRLMR